jgi:hypothetical protein
LDRMTADRFYIINQKEAETEADLGIDEINM